MARTVRLSSEKKLTVCTSMNSHCLTSRDSIRPMATQVDLVRISRLSKCWGRLPTISLYPCRWLYQLWLNQMKSKKAKCLMRLRRKDFYSRHPRGKPLWAKQIILRLYLNRKMKTELNAKTMSVLLLIPQKTCTSRLWAASSFWSALKSWNLVRSAIW